MQLEFEEIVDVITRMDRKDVYVLQDHRLPF
jgi:hypothetical protein